MPLCYFVPSLENRVADGWRDMRTTFHPFLIPRAHSEPPQSLMQKNSSGPSPSSQTDSFPIQFQHISLGIRAAASSPGVGFKLWKEQSSEDIMLHPPKWCQETQEGGGSRNRKYKEAWDCAGTIWSL